MIEIQEKKNRARHGGWRTREVRAERRERKSGNEEVQKLEPMCPNFCY